MAVMSSAPRSRETRFWVMGGRSSGTGFRKMHDAFRADRSVGHNTFNAYPGVLPGRSSAAPAGKGPMHRYGAAEQGFLLNSA